MAARTAFDSLRGLVLSAAELKSLTDWPDALVEDYLNLIDNLITLADLVDIEINQKLEEVPTDFSDGSVPFAEDGFLAEDNSNLVWDNLNNILNVFAIKLLSLAPGSVLYINDDNLISEDTPSLIWDDVGKILSAINIYTSKVSFNLVPGVTPGEGELVWNEDDGTLDLGMPGGNVTLQIGQELQTPRSTASGSDIDNGELVYVSGASGSNPLMSLAQADASATSSGTIAMATEDVLQNQKGYFTAFGLVRDVNTGTYTEGDQLYLSPTVPGGYTNVKPVQPYFIIKVGIVMRAHATEGVIFVTINQRTNNFVHIRGMIPESIPFSNSDGFLDENNPGFTYDGTHAYMGADSAKWFFGLGNDYSILYDGIDAWLKTNEVSPSDLIIECGTEKTFELANVVWDDDKFPASGQRLDSASSRYTYDFFNGGISFDADARYPNEILSMLELFPHTKKLETVVRPHIHWMQTEAAEPNWLLGYKILNNGDTTVDEVDFSNYIFLIKDTNAFTYVSGNLIQTTSFGDVATTGLGTSSMIHWVLWRDTTNASGEFAGADPVATSQTLFEFDVHFQIDTLGSRQEFIK